MTKEISMEEIRERENQKTMDRLVREGTFTREEVDAIDRAYNESERLALEIYASNDLTEQERYVVDSMLEMRMDYGLFVEGHLSDEKDGFSENQERHYEVLQKQSREYGISQERFEELRKMAYDRG